MLLNYLKLATRLLVRNPFLSFVNVLGLSIGFAAFFALWQYSTSELKTDQYHKDFERIVRIGFHQRWDEPGNTGNLTFGHSSASIPPQIKNDFPEVESYVRISEQGGFFQDDLHEGHGVRMVISYRGDKGEEKIFKETKAAYADRNIFEFFAIPLIHGDPKTALAGVNFVALSQSLSEKYFGKENPIGEALLINDSITLKVGGVFEDFPHNSKLTYDMIISNDGLLTKWTKVYWGGTVNFVKLKSGTSIKDFETKINRQKRKYWADITTCKCGRILFVQPLKDIVFSQGFIGDGDAYKSKTILITLAIVSVVILGMAWINYINLSITCIGNRMKEFATRRVNGASALDLLKQFLTESLLMNALAVGLALTILQLIRQPLETGLEIYIPEIWSTKAETWFWLMLTLIGGVLITGVYPAYVCITHQPRVAFIMRSGNNNKSFVTSLLTTGQLAASVTLISWVFVVYLQLNYILNKDMGLNRRGVVIVEGPIVKPPRFDQTFETFVSKLKDLRDVEQATFSKYMVGDAANKPGDVKRIGSNITTGAEANGVAENYLPFFGLKIMAGRNFIKDDRADVIIISQVSARRLGFQSPEDAIGARVMVNTGNWNIQKEAEVIGVADDYRVVPYFNYDGTNTIVAEGGFGLFLAYKDKLFPELAPENIAIIVNLGNIDDALADVEEQYKIFFPGNTFEWRFLDDQIKQIYGNEKIVRNQILMFTFLAIGIACLGLVAMMAQRIFEKTKEIGIRKVLGASIFELGRTLIRTTGIQFFAAAALGIPLAYFLGDQYLQRYSERISLTWWHYLLPVGILLLIMFCTVANMLWKAVRSNPVESLKHE